jgi:hypothetical protein
LAEITIMTWIDAPQELCFDLALDVAAHAESAAFSGERLVAPGRLQGRLEVGDLVCFEGRHLGFRQTFCARITSMDRPHVFVDEMTRGVFAWLRHVHEFKRERRGTLMIDRLTSPRNRRQARRPVVSRTSYDLVRYDETVASEEDRRGDGQGRVRPMIIRFGDASSLLTVLGFASLVPLLYDRAHFHH